MRKSFSGASPRTTLTVAVDNNPATLTLNCADLTGWLTGASAPFNVTLDRDTTFEEKVLVTTRVGNVLTLAQRGYDGTVARAHAVGCTVEHTITAIDADEANRLANLLHTKGALYVFNGANVVELVPGVADEVLMADAADPEGVRWFSRLIPISASAPAYKLGDRYYDTTLKTLMVGVGGSWQPSALGVAVFANAAARNAALGATNTNTGQQAFLIDQSRLTLAIGLAGWQDLPKPGEYSVHYANEAAVLASALPDNSLATATDTGQVYTKRPITGWIPIGQRITVESGSGFPANALDGDLHAIPVS